MNARAADISIPPVGTPKKRTIKRECSMMLEPEEVTEAVLKATRLPKKAQGATAQSLVIQGEFAGYEIKWTEE